jgi:gliding motility-associated-like protein
MKHANKIFFAFMLISAIGAAQAPTCDVNVPFFSVNLVGQPAGQWTSPTHSRQGDCCSDQRCTSFMVLLDSNAAMVEVGFDIISDPSQAIPSGSLNYQVNCGPLTPVGSPICIVGPGPHYITFCKPGNNQNTYYVRSIPRPLFPEDDSVRIGCSPTLSVLGLEPASISWQSIFPGAPGDYNSFLSCTNCTAPVYTATTGAPAFIDYKICGYPIADECGYTAVCDTVRIYNIAALTAIATPNPATFCAGGPGTSSTGSAIGGLAPYSYIWRNSSLNIISTVSVFSTATGGAYALEVRDALYDSTFCPGSFVNVPFVAVPPPTVAAGADQILCPGSPAVLNATITSATGVIWTGGAGTFSPSNTSLLTSYTPTPGEVASGSVTLTATTTGAGGGCSNASDQITIFYPSALAVNLANINLSCNGDSVNLSPVVSGGTAPYQYQWSTGATSTSVWAHQGSYCVTITDALGCSFTDCGTVTTPSPLTISMSSTAATTNGGNDGTASTIIGGGTAPYSYNWTPGNPTGDGTPNITGLVYGIYTVTVTDANGCQIHSSIVVNEPRCAGFQVSATATSVSCFGGENGTATATAITGTGPFTYTWTTVPQQTTQTAVNIPAGIYQVMVFDQSNNCTALANVTITQPPQLTTTTTQTNVSTIGGNDGSATVNAFGGTPGYNYLWSNSVTTPTISSLTAGSYSVTVTDQNGCVSLNNVLINQPPCNTLTAAVNTTDVSCNGDSTGAASVTVLFATAPVTYLWSTGATTSSISNVPAGNYTVTVTDALNCPVVVNFTITQPSPLNALVSPTAISCNGYGNGTLELFVSGGVFPYNYAWSNGVSVQDQINLSQGNYSVTVTDAQGCTVTASAVISEPSTISVSSVTVPVTCFGGNDGGVNITPIGGVGGYTYSWSNLAATQDISSLTFGTYSVTITDLNGCTLNSPFVFYVNQPSVVSDSVYASCPVPGSGLAQITVIPSGGNSVFYQISVDSGNTYLTSGVYTALMPVDSLYFIQVRDSLGCILPLADSISVNSEVAVASALFNPCVSDGVSQIPVFISANGGSGSYVYSTDGGVNFLAPGVDSVSLATGSNYTIVAQDSTGCNSVGTLISLPVELIPAGITSIYAGGFEIACNGDSSGWIDVTVAGGSGSMSYSWSTGDATQDLDSIVAGVYTLVVTDSLSCSDTITFTLAEPTLLTSTVLSSTNYNGYSVSCNGASDAGADLTVSGGVATYTYNWSNNSQNEDLSSVPAGTYSVTITDANGCVTASTVTLNEPTAITAASAVTDVLCSGFETGVVDLTVNGGIPSYTYLWNTNAVTEDIDSLAAGTYSVVITDANGCQHTLNATVSQSSPVIATATGTSLLCYQDATGSADLSVVGGGGIYTYSWSTGQTTQDLTGVQAGTYTVVVTDNLNCADTTIVYINEPAQLNAYASATVFSNGYNVSGFGNNDGSVNLTAAGGTQPYSYAWSNGASSEDLNGVSGGTYYVTVTDNNGCAVSDTVYLSEPFALEMPTGYSPNGDGANDAFVVRGIEAFPNSKLEVFNRWGNLVYDSDNYINQWKGTTNTGENLPDGTYFVILTVNEGDITLHGYVDIRR